MTSSGRFAVTMGLCALVVSACGVSDRPLNVNSATPDTGGTSSSGGAPSPGGSSSNGGVETVGGRSSSGGTGAGGSGGGGASGPDTTPSITGPATTASDGTLTNLIGASFVKTGGALVITSFYAAIDVLPSYNAIHLWGDIENRGSSIECIPLVTLAINNYDVLTVATGPAYRGSTSVSTSCLPPGGRGVISGIDSNVSSTLLDGATTVTYSFDTTVISGAVPHPGAPTLTGVTVDGASGSYAITGTMRAGSVDIYNVDLDFFIRDSSGLLRDEQNAFPGDLGTIVAGSATPFTTSGSVDAFARYVEFPSFIEGVSANALQGPAAEFEARKRLVDQRFAAVAAARRVIRR